MKQLLTLVSAAILITVVGYFLPMSFLSHPLPSGIIQSHRLDRARAILGGIEFALEVADTPELRARGLAGRTSLGGREGMLFLFPVSGRHTFWMKGMLVPIDIIWLRGDEIVWIEERVAPPDAGTPDHLLPRYAPDTPADRVIEIRAGRSSELGLTPRQHVTILLP